MNITNGKYNFMYFQKSGKWCAVHVRVAWEIYHHQQKQQAESQKPPGDKPSTDPLRPPSHLLPGGPLHRPDLNPLLPPGTH